ncbi:hypothetical protein D3C80_1610120 [compost metagenome]
MAVKQHPAGIGSIKHRRQPGFGRGQRTFAIQPQRVVQLLRGIKLRQLVNGPGVSKIVGGAGDHANVAITHVQVLILSDLAIIKASLALPNTL